MLLLLSNNHIEIDYRDIRIWDVMKAIDLALSKEKNRGALRNIDRNVDIILNEERYLNSLAVLRKVFFYSLLTDTVDSYYATFQSYCLYK